MQAYVAGVIYCHEALRCKAFNCLAILTFRMLILCSARRKPCPRAQLCGVEICMVRCFSGGTPANCTALAGFALPIYINQMVVTFQLGALGKGLSMVLQRQRCNRSSLSAIIYTLTPAAAFVLGYQTSLLAGRLDPEAMYRRQVVSWR